MTTQKNLIATIYLKNGEAVKGYKDLTPSGDLFEKVRRYNDNGIDKLMVFDLSAEDEEHEINLHTLKEINRVSEIPVYAGGNINRLEDIKKIIYTGCKKAILNSSKPEVAELIQEGKSRFGQDKIALSILDVDLVFKQREMLEKNVSEIVLLNPSLVGTIENVTELPYIPILSSKKLDEYIEILKNEHIKGVSGALFDDVHLDIIEIKKQLKEKEISTGRLDSTMRWSDFKVNSDGLMPVIVQDYRTQEVLMLAYMNEEAYETTISIGKMTYYSRSRQELWIKGMTSGHFQYVKSLVIDCDNDTILAKVSQVGAACHTGNPTCFFTDLVKSEFTDSNPLKVFENEYAVISDRKKHPKEGSYTNYLFDKGIDKILKKVGEEATEIVIAAKNPEPEEIKYEIADFLYHVMVLMVEKGLTWNDVTEELAQR